MNSNNESKDRVYNLLEHFHSHKYILIKDSLLVGLIVGVTIVIYRFLAAKIGEMFTDIYLQGRNNLLLIPFIFLLLIALGYFVALQVKKEPKVTVKERLITQVSKLFAASSCSWLIFLAKFFSS